MYTFVYTPKKVSFKSTPQPLQRGFVFVFPIVFFAEFRLKFYPYEPVPILDIDYLCPILARAHYARKTPSKYEKFNVKLREI